MLPGRHAAAILSIAILVAACGAQTPSGAAIGSGSAQASDDGTASPIPTAEPTPTPPTLRQLGRMYLGSVRPFNQRLCSYNNRWIGTSYAEWQALGGANQKLARAYRNWADALREIPWTKDVRRDAMALIRAVAQDEAALLATARASSLAEYAELQARADKLNQKASGLANVLRGALGIESVSGDACE